MEPTLPDTEYLYDFLYVDGSRLATYMAQVDPNGILTGIKTTSSGSTTVSGSGTLSAVVVSGGMTGTDTVVEGAERQFDPIHTIPIAVLNRLDELGFIHKTVDGTPLGSLILVKGYCRIANIGMVKEMWPEIAKIIRQKDKEQKQSQTTENRHARRSQAAQKRVEAGEEEPDLIGILKNLPHAVMLHMACDIASGAALLWSTLKTGSLLTSAEEISLKYGSALAGEWYALGVLDCGPDNGGFAKAWQQVPCNVLPTVIMGLAEMVRRQMGRPDEWNGMTPLMIFRKIPRPQREEVQS